MFRKAIEEDRDLVLEYLNDEPAFNLFIIGDIENFGFEEDFQDVYIDICEGEIKCVLLRYKSNVIPYFKDNKYDVTELRKIMSTIDATALSGKKEIVDKVKDVYNIEVDRDTYFCELKGKPKELTKTNYNVIKATKKEEFLMAADLLRSIEEFVGEFDGESYYMEYKKGAANTYVVIDDNQAISVARTTAHTSTSVMVVGVGTHIDHRNKGLASATLTKMSIDVYNTGKSACLFYDNPSAGSLYKKLGYKDIGIWKFITIKE